MFTLRRLATRAFEHSLGYRTLQAPLHEQELTPFPRRMHRHPGMRVLNVSWSPDTNAAHIGDMRRTGVDINPESITKAQHHSPGQFLARPVNDPTVFCTPGAGATSPAAERDV